MFNQDCKTCKVLHEQLDFERSRNKELTETLTSLIKPRVILQDNSAELKPLGSKFQTWRHKREELERLDREEAKLRKNSPVIAKPEPIETKPVDPVVEQLEMELGIV